MALVLILVAGVVPPASAAGDDAHLGPLGGDRGLLGGSSGTLAWNRQFGTPVFDELLGVAVDGSGAYAVGSTAGVLPGQIPSGARDAFVRKFDASGTELWTRMLGTTALDQALGVAVDASGAYVVGRTFGYFPGSGNAGLSDAFLVKFDSAGTILWTREFGTVGTDLALGVAADPSGAYVAGWTDGVLPGQTGAGLMDAFIRKYDPAGAELWTRQFGTAGTDQALGVDLDSSGAYLVGLTDGAFPGFVNGGLTDAFARKYDATGNVLWTRQFGTAAADQALGVAVGPSATYVVGWTDGLLPGQTSLGPRDAFTRKYDSAGTELWTRQYGTTSLDEALGVDADASGVYTVGWTLGAFPGFTGAGSTDVFVRKYDASGTLMWTRQFGTTGPDQAAGVATDGSSAYVVGATAGTLPGQGSNGSTDAFARKHDGAGTELWTRQFGAALADVALGIAVAAPNVYVVGRTMGIFPGTPPAGPPDAFIRAYDVSGIELWTDEPGLQLADEATAVAVYGDAVYLGGVWHRGGGIGDDGVVRRYDVGGNRVWVRIFGASGRDGDEQILGIAADASGVYVAGRTTGGFAGFTNAGAFDAFVRKYDPSGVELWTDQFGTRRSDWVTGIAVDASGVYVSGASEDILPGQTGAGQVDAFARKYTPDGYSVWTRQFGTAGMDEALGLAVDASGLYLAGRTLGTFPGQTSAGSEDMFLRKFDPNGFSLWTRQFGSPGIDRALGVSVHASAVTIAGTTLGVLPGQVSAGGSDAFARTYDSTGNEVWTRQLGTAGTDEAHGIAVDDSGVYVAGWSDGTLPGESTAGGQDAFVARFLSPPTPPRGLLALGGDGSADLTWESPVWDGASPITNFRIYRGTTAGNLSFLGVVGRVLSYSDTGLTNGATYFYAVTAVNAVGEGPPSAVATGLPRGISSAPQRLGGSAGDGQISLEWESPVADGGSPITNFRIYRGTLSGTLSFLVQIGTSLVYVDAGLTNGVTYFYQVTAINALGESPPSNEASGTAGAAPGDTTPPEIRLTSPTVTLTRDLSVVVAGITEPGATVRVDGTSVPVAPDGTFSTARGLAEGANTIVVEATDAAGNTGRVDVSIRRDSTPPVLSISAPMDGAHVTTNVISVTGTTESGARLVVNGLVLNVGTDGSFGVMLALTKGSNQIRAVASDPAGNTAAASVTVTLDESSGVGGDVAQSLAAQLFILTATVVALAVLSGVLLFIAVGVRRKLRTLTLPREEKGT